MLSIKHLTRYCYARELKSGVQQLRLTPLKSKFQKIRNWNVGLRGGRETLSYKDQFGNQTRFVEIVDGASEIEVEIEGEIDVIDNAGMLGVQKEAVPLWVYLMETPLTRAGEKLRAFMNVKFPDGAVESLHFLSGKIRGELNYADSVSKVGWSSEDVLTAKVGVCQDFAHVFITAARNLGHPARYVSGYLKMDSEKQTAMHAWVEVFVQGVGWVGFDAANGICPDEKYVRVAIGRDYYDAAPFRGISYGADIKEELDVRIHISQQ